MKKTPNMIIGFWLVVSVIACEKDTVDPPDGNPAGVVIVKFAEDDQIAENAAAKEIVISFNKPAHRDGSILLDIDSDDPESFQTEPPITDDQIELAVSEGDQFASFSFKPIDNKVLDGNKNVSFEIVEVSDGFRIGTDKNMTMVILDDEQAATVNFVGSEGSLNEDSQEGLMLDIQFSAPLQAAGKVFIQLKEVSHLSLFRSQPGFDIDGLLELDIPLGSTREQIHLIGRDNDLLKGHHNLEFSISGTEGAIIKGTSVVFKLTLLDDELLFKARSFETVGGGWKSRKTYVYEESGKVQFVHWETETPGLRKGTDTYYYAANGLIERVNHFANHDEYYFQENGRIVRSENIENGVKKSYSEYDYDPAGNVGGKAVYYRQASGQFELGFIYIYLYFDDGNLYKQLTYTPTNDPDNPQLISTRTYEGYSSLANPFSTIEMIPGIVAQPNLPGSYRLEENGSDLLYRFSYEFRENGLPVNRTATSTAGSDFTTYEYY